MDKVDFKIDRNNDREYVLNKVKTLEKKDYIKRVIGVPGDTLEYKNDQLYINDKKVNETYLQDYKNLCLVKQMDIEDYRRNYHATLQWYLSGYRQINNYKFLPTL